MIIVSNDSGNSKICDSEVAVRIEDKIFRLEISMNNFFVMEVLKADNDVSDEEFGFGLGKLALTTDVVSEVTSVKIVDNKIKIFPILEGVKHVHNERVVKLGKKCSLVHDGVN